MGEDYSQEGQLVYSEGLVFTRHTHGCCNSNEDLFLARRWNFSSTELYWFPNVLNEDCFLYGTHTGVVVSQRMVSFSSVQVKGVLGGCLSLGLLGIANKRLFSSNYQGPSHRVLILYMYTLLFVKLGCLRLNELLFVRKNILIIL